LGSIGYDVLMIFHRMHDGIRKTFGLPYWSLTKYVKSRVKNAVKHVQRYTETVASDARVHGFDAVICGHIHQAELKQINGVLYCNDGDWVESCTALVESNSGSLELVHWRAQHQVAGSAIVEEALVGEKAA
nr:UDP-2,3-diacylglucosamine diphosphatase [Granulosicoccus sp.]